MESQVICTTTKKKLLSLLNIWEIFFLVGGGCGLSVLSHFGVATENTKMAMPETRFGHFCDGGSNFFLSRLNGYLGKYIALCAQTIVAEDVLYGKILFIYVYIVLFLTLFNY